METLQQDYSPLQYFFGILFTAFCILYVGGIYLVLTDKEERRKNGRV